MKCTILGSGGWDGSPAPFSSKKTEKRTRPQLFIEGKSGNFMIECSPDIRLQSKNLPKVTHFFISHWHFDHAFGLFELDAYSLFEETINMYCSEETAIWIKKNCNHFPINIHILKAYKEINLFGVKITPLPVYHTTKDDKGTFGYRIVDEKQNISYLADYYDIPQKTLEIVKKSDKVIADATYLFEELFDEKYKQVKNDTTHIHGENIISFCKEFKQVIFHSNSSHHNLTTREINNKLPPNMKASEDNMRIDIL